MAKTKPRTTTEILGDLEQVRVELEQCDQQALRAKRNRLWEEGREAKIDSRALADVSGVESVTVRAFWNPKKVQERAKLRKGKPRKPAKKS